MPGKCKDLIMDIATEEMGHDEMIATVVCQAAGRSTGHRRHQGCCCRSGGRRGARRDESAAGNRRQGRRAAAQGRGQTRLVVAPTPPSWRKYEPRPNRPRSTSSWSRRPWAASRTATAAGYPPTRRSTAAPRCCTTRSSFSRPSKACPCWRPCPQPGTSSPTPTPTASSSATRATPHRCSRQPELRRRLHRPLRRAAVLAAPGQHHREGDRRQRLTRKPKDRTAWYAPRRIRNLPPGPPAAGTSA
jgi:hypothetical protein